MFQVSTCQGRHSTHSRYPIATRKKLPTSFLEHIQPEVSSKTRCAVLLMGQSGSGKSTMKGVLKELCDWTCIDSDILKRHDPQGYAENCTAIYEKRRQALPPNLATPEALKIIEKNVKTEYQCAKVAELLTNTDKSWLFDTRGNKQQVIKKFLDQAKNFGLPIIIIHLRVSLKTAIERTTLRATHASKDDPKKDKLMSPDEVKKYNDNIRRQHTLIQDIARRGQATKIVTIDND